MSGAIKKVKRNVTAREGAKLTGYSERSVRRLIAQPRAAWIEEQATRRETIRAYHDDEGNSWSETAAHFKLHYNTVKQLAYRARKERELERELSDQHTLF